MPYEKIGKNEPVCIANEVPFEIPKSWEWVRLGTICTKLVDGDHNPPKGCISKTEYIMASSTNINNDTIVELEKVRYLTPEIFQKENERTKVESGDIFFTSVGSLGRSCVYTGGLNICFQRSVSVITTLILNYYLKYCLDSGYIQQKIIREATGTAQKGFYLNQLSTVLIPVPPEKEQYKIVEQYEKIVPFLANYSEVQQKAQMLNAGFPELLKKSILQEAVQGKLVAQDPSDESASALLERIRAEKERLIQEGKIKQDKHESVIYRRDNSYYEKRGSEEVCIDDEISFEIPSNWCWCRFSAICYKLTDGSHNPPPKKTNGFRVISARNIKNGRILFTDEDRLCDQNGFNKENPRTQISKGDVILGIIGGSIGNTAIYGYDEPVIAQRSIAIFGSLINNKYMKLLLDSPLFQQQFNSKSNGTAQGGIYLGELANMLVPLPPVNEQNRILASISSLENKFATM